MIPQEEPLKELMLMLEERLMICLFHDLLNFVPFLHPNYYLTPAVSSPTSDPGKPVLVGFVRSGSQDITLGVRAEKKY